MAEVTSIAPLLHEPGLIAYECPRCGCFGNSRNLSIRVASGLANGLACINQSCIQTSCVVAEVRASPNHNERKNGMMPDTIILHYTGTRDIEDRIRQLCTMGSEVSAHYVVLQDGYIIQLVPEWRAWHAAVSSWAGDIDLNSRSIGIEIANPGHESTALQTLCKFFWGAVSINFEKRCNHYRLILACMLSGVSRDRPVIVGWSTAPRGQVIEVSLGQLPKKLAAGPRVLARTESLRPQSGTKQGGPPHDY